MRSYWITVVPKSSNGVLTRKPYEDTDPEGRTPGECRGRDWSDTSITQRTSKSAANTRNQKSKHRTDPFLKP